MAVVGLWRAVQEAWGERLRGVSESGGRTAWGCPEGGVGESGEDALGRSGRGGAEKFTY